MKTPCEIVIWHILPAIRRELTRSLVHNLGCSQRKAAQLLGMTDAAISQYLSGKRAKLLIKDEEILDEISSIAQHISHGEGLTTKDFCKICTKVRTRPEIINEFGIYQCAYSETDLENDQPHAQHED